MHSLYCVNPISPFLSRVSTCLWGVYPAFGNNYPCFKGPNFKCKILINVSLCLVWATALFIILKFNTIASLTAYYLGFYSVSVLFTSVCVSKALSANRVSRYFGQLSNDLISMTLDAISQKNWLMKFHFPLFFHLDNRLHAHTHIFISLVDKIY